MQLRCSNLFTSDIESDLKIIKHSIFQLEQRYKEIFEDKHSEEQQIKAILEIMPQFAIPVGKDKKINTLREKLLKLLNHDTNQLIREASETAFYDAIYDFLFVLAKHYPCNPYTDTSDEITCFLSYKKLQQKADVMILAEGYQLFIEDPLFNTWFKDIDSGQKQKSPLGTLLNSREVDYIKKCRENFRIAIAAKHLAEEKEQALQAVKKVEEEKAQVARSALLSVIIEENVLRLRCYREIGLVIGFISGPALVVGLTFLFIPLMPFALTGSFVVLVTTFSAIVAAFISIYLGRTLANYLAEGKNQAALANIEANPDPNKIAARRAILIERIDRPKNYAVIGMCSGALIGGIGGAAFVIFNIIVPACYVTTSTIELILILVTGSITTMAGSMLCVCFGALVIGLPLAIMGLFLAGVVNVVADRFNSNTPNVAPTPNSEPSSLLHKQAVASEQQSELQISSPTPKTDTFIPAEILPLHQLAVRQQARTRSHSTTGLLELCRSGSDERLALRKQPSEKEEKSADRQIDTSGAALSISISTNQQQPIELPKGRSSALRI